MIINRDRSILISTLVDTTFEILHLHLLSWLWWLLCSLLLHHLLLLHLHLSLLHHLLLLLLLHHLLLLRIHHNLLLARWHNLRHTRMTWLSWWPSCLLLLLLLHLLMHLSHLCWIKMILIHFTRQMMCTEQDIHVVCIENSSKLLIHLINIHLRGKR